MSEWEVFAGIAARIGTSMPLPGGDLPLDGSATDDTMLDLAYAKGRMPMDEVRARRGTIHEATAITVIAAEPGAQARFAVAPADVVEELHGVLAEQTAAEVLTGFVADDFPFRLISRRLKHVLNSLGRELPGLARVGTTNFAYLHPDDMRALALVDGDLIEITSPFGTIVGVAEASSTMKRGVVSMAHSWGGSVTDEAVRQHGSPTNRLCSVATGYDRLNGMAIQSAIPIRIARSQTLA